MPPGHPAALTAFWFAGDRESAPNVQIAASQYLRADGKWTPAKYVVNREVLSAQLGFGVRRLGNPVGWMDPAGRMHLFVVATGLGGWAAGRIVHLRQTEATAGLQTMDFLAERVLPLSWLWNTSFLVRTAPLPLADGGMVLPVHFELGLKYPVALRFSAQGAFLGMVRISSRPYMLQPTLLMQGPGDWLALTRDYRPNGKIGVSRTRDGGLHWTDLPDLAQDNPDASIAGIGLAPGHMVLSHNPTTHGRASLDLSGSQDGLLWNQLHAIERGAPAEEYSYPAMAWGDGALWVSYTDHRRSIAWQRYVAGAP
jgi:predicted neuraminidase